MRAAVRIGIDGRKIPESKARGPVASLEHGHALGMEGLFFRTVLDMSPTLDPGALSAIRKRADELDMYLEAGLGKVNPFASPEAPELRAIGNGDVLKGFRRMMEACAAIGCRELWVGTANRKPAYFGRLSYDRFRTDVSWTEQLAATEWFLHRLAPIARDLAVHINVETHEEITSFEVLRLVEAVGADVLGIVYDTSNGLHRLEVPTRVARRVAPYVRQMHIKDAYLGAVPGGIALQNRPCGEGVVDFSAILPIVWEANPAVNWTIESAEPHAERTVGRTRTVIEAFDSGFLAGHPDLTVDEYAAYMAMVESYGRDFPTRGCLDYEAHEERPFGYDEAVADIRASGEVLRAIAGRLQVRTPGA